MSCFCDEEYQEVLLMEYARSHILLANMLYFGGKNKIYSVMEFFNAFHLKLLEKEA